MSEEEVEAALIIISVDDNDNRMYTPTVGIVRATLGDIHQFNSPSSYDVRQDMLEKFGLQDGRTYHNDARMCVLTPGIQAAAMFDTVRDEVRAREERRKKEIAQAQAKAAEKKRLKLESAHFRRTKHIGQIMASIGMTPKYDGVLLGYMRKDDAR